MNRKGFTFIEILVVLALVGVIATCAVAPMVHIVGNMRAAQSDVGEEAAVQDVFRLICRDIRSVLVLPKQTYIALRKKDLFGGKADDVLAVESASLIRNTMVPGVVVYGLVRENTLESGSVLPGLYRWAFPGRAVKDLDLKSSMPMDRAALVLPSVDSFRVEVYMGKDNWSGKYAGGIPVAIRIKLDRGGRSHEIVDWFPAL